MITTESDKLTNYITRAKLNNLPRNNIRTNEKSRRLIEEACVAKHSKIENLKSK